MNTAIIGTIVTAIPTILKGLGLVCLGSSAVAAATPTPKDDSFWSKAYEIVDFCAGNFGHAKEQG